MILKKYVIYFKFFLCLSSLFYKSNIYAVTINYDHPIQQRIFNLEKNKQSHSAIVRNCYEYFDYYNVEDIDKEQKGGALIGITPKRKGSNFLNICQKKYSTFPIKMTADGYYEGKIQQYMINKGDDSFGSEYLFQIFIIEKAKVKKIFEGLRHVNQSYEYIRHKNGKLGVRYWKSLKITINCPVKDNKCLENIKVANKIKTELNFTDCKKSIAEEITRLKKAQYDATYLNETEGNQFFIFIEIPDITKKYAYKILNTRVLCENRP